MNVQVIWEGSDITHHTVEYTRQHDICTGIGSLDLIIEANTNFNFNPWNSIIIKEEGTQVALYNITSTEKTSPDGTYIIAAQDNSKRLTDYFIDHEYTAETLSNTRTWIELILSEAGIVNYSINTISTGEPVTIGSQFGLRPAYDAIINLLQLSGWYMYFDSNGTCQIGELNTNKTPVHNFHDTTTLEIRTIKNDKMLRNRVYVWGSFEENTGWVYAKAETYLPWFRDDGEDWRSVVYQNSAIYYYSTAIKMANKMLSEFSKQTPEKEIHVVGLHPDLHVGVYIKSLGTYGTGVGQVTSYVVNVNAEGGATTTLIIDKRCPRLFGISDIKSQFIYIGTDNSGVYRKGLDSGYWSAYNINLDTAHIRDLSAYDNVLSAVTNDGKLYINKTGGWTQYSIPTQLTDAKTGSGISTASGYFIATSSDVNYSFSGSGTFAGITAVFSVHNPSGFEFLNPLPVYAASGNRAWVVGITADGTERYTQQIYYDAQPRNYGGYVESGRVYDVGVQDLSTNDLGHNIISIKSPEYKYYTGKSFGSYSHLYSEYVIYNKNLVVGKNIYISIPPATQGRYVKAEDWGGYTYLNGNYMLPYIYFSPSGCVGASYTFELPSYDSSRVSFYYNYLPAGSVSSVSESYTIYNSDLHAALEGYGGKLIKVNDSIFGYISAGYPYGFLNWFEINKDLEEVTTQKNFQPPVIGGHTDGYQSTGTMGTDGKFFVQYGSREHVGIDGGSGFAFVRVIDVETGNITYYYEIHPTEPPPYYGNLGYHVDLAGKDESPNHCIIAYAATANGEPDSFDQQQPETLIWIFIINKYTGQVNTSQLKHIWKCQDYGNDSWSSSHGSGLNNNAKEYRHSFFKFQYEDIDGGFGLALLNLNHEILGKNFSWSHILFPPWLVYGLNYKGTYHENACYWIGIPGGYVNQLRSYMYIYEHNDNQEPPIPEYEFTEKPIWLIGQSTDIQCLYSRMGLAPVVWYAMSDSLDVTNFHTLLAFSAGWSPDVYNIITPAHTPELYHWDVNDDWWHLNVTYPSFSPILDSVDNTIYWTTTSGYGTLFGCNTAGTITKELNANVIYSTPLPLANKTTISAGNDAWGFMNWPSSGSGIANVDTLHKVLYHRPEIAPSGSFTILFEYKNALAVETGMGLPTVFYDPPLATTGWLYHKNSTVLGASWTNSGEVPTMVPNTYITDARLLDIFQGANFPLASGYTLPDNYFSRFLGTVDSANNTIKIFNTEYDTNKDRYSVIHFFPIGWDVTHIDFTNFFPSPYIFSSPITSSSGQQFFQRFTEEGVFYDLSTGLPVGSLITIIRADDRM